MTHKRPLDTAGQALPARSTMRPGEARVTLSRQLSTSLQHLQQRITLLPEPYACCVLFFTVAAQGADTGVFFVRRSTLEAAWREGSTRVRQWAWVRQLSAIELRIDWPSEIMVIGSRIPSLCQSGEASAWALADDDLEHAELIPPLALSHARPSDLGNRLEQCMAAPSMLPVRSEVNLLLRLQGLHTGEDGLATALPKVAQAPPMPWSAPTPGSSPPRAEAPCCAAPFHAGSHPHGCDRRCVTYALLLAQHRVADNEFAQAGVVQAIERAFTCLEKNIDSLGMRADAADIEQSMCLLIFTRYISSRKTDGAFDSLVQHMERLAQHLSAIKRTPPADSGR